MSTPFELNNLVERLGQQEAIRAVRRWIGEQDARIFLAAGGGGARAAPEGIPPPAWRRENDSLSQPYPLQRVGGLGRAASLAVTSSAPEPPAPGTEDEASLAPPLDGNPCPCGENRGADCDCHEEQFREEEEPRVADCDLHWTHESNGAGGAALGPTHNGRGYSTFSPPCNGCPIGQQERAAGIWHSGFGQERNVFYGGRTPDGRPAWMPLHPPQAGSCVYPSGVPRPPGSPAPLAGERSTPFGPTPSGGLAPTSSEWYSGGAALCATASGDGGLAASSSADCGVLCAGGGGAGLCATASGGLDYRQFSRLQTVMLDCLREAEEEPTAQWRIDNLVNAMERFREAGGADGDNYRYCQQRLAELQR